MKKIFKKWYFWVAIIAIIIGIVGISGGSEDSSSTETTGAKVETVVTASDNTIDGSTVTIDSCTFGTNYEGKKTVIVSYTYTNINNDESTSFDVGLIDKVFQEGVELKPDYLFENDYSDNSGKSIKRELLFVQIKPIF